VLVVFELEDTAPVLATVQVKLVPPKLSVNPLPVTCPGLSWTKRSCAKHARPGAGRHPKRAGRTVRLFRKPIQRSR